ncbi:hypothetical protein [Shewanella algae]|uniref:hypothetical protein n=1 Tax=Shewanella algae TaxID=38313 RepID=UPI001C5A5661|nr:hypothetical protein [Shewanella algae]
MSLKIKWIMLKSKKSIDELYSLIKSSPYDKTSESGFIRHSFIEGTKVSATYVECKKYLSEVQDPFGDVIEQEIVNYYYIEFCIEMVAKGIYLISIFNPPQSVRNLITFLSEKLNYEVSFSSLSVDVNKFLSFVISSSNATSVKVEKLKVSGLILNRNSKASIEIVSSSDASQDILHFIENKSYTMDRVKAIALNSGNVIKFELSKSGNVTVQENFADLFENIIKSYLKVNHFNM